jgi:hypothetical protein
MRRRWFVPALILAFVLALVGLVGSNQAQTPGAEQATYLELWKTIKIDGEPQAIVVSCAGPGCNREHEVIFFDAASDSLRFIDAETGALTTNEIILLHESGFDSFLEYDRYYRQAYITGDDEKCDDWGLNCWRRMWLYIIAGRARLNSIVINEEHKDFRYDVDGFALKQPGIEGRQARVIIDNTIHGNIDVVDLDAEGLEAMELGRASYRAPVACADEPTCVWKVNEGNSLALETQYQTQLDDNLRSSDLLYIGDDNGIYGHIRVLRISHPGPSLSAAPLPDIDLTGVFPCSVGVRGLSMAGPRDLLYMPSGCQSFAEGYVGAFDTTSSAVTTVTVPYLDQNFVEVDWYDPKRVFVATSDGFCRGDSPYDPSCGLYLHLIYDDVLVDSLRLMTDYPLGGLKDMAFDPYELVLYLTVEDSIISVRVNYGAGAAPVAPAVGEDVITPGAGGDVKAPDRSADLHFLAGAVDQDAVVTYHEGHAAAAAAPDVRSGLAAASDLVPVRDFQVSAVISGTTTPITAFNAPYQLNIHYTEKEKGAAIEGTLALYHWDGAAWVLEPSSSVSTSGNVVSAGPTETGLFAVMGETRRVYLPTVIR